MPPPRPMGRATPAPTRGGTPGAHVGRSSCVEVVAQDASVEVDARESRAPPEGREAVGGHVDLLEAVAPPERVAAGTRHERDLDVGTDERQRVLQQSRADSIPTRR